MALVDRRASSGGIGLSSHAALSLYNGLYIAYRPCPELQGQDQAMLPLLREAPAGRIVNVSSSLGSLALNGDPTSTYYSSQFIGYNASKAALNMLTVQLNEELRGTPITVNSVSPGFVKTDLTGYGTLTPEEGARILVQYALGGEKSGQFVEASGETPW